MIFVVGSDGMLGSAVIRELSFQKKPFFASIENFLDITDEMSVYRFMYQYRPSVIINCAAYTDVDGCEKNPEKAMHINGYAVSNLSKASKSVNAKFIHISTDYVFNGEKESPYTEKDKIDPLQVYGRSKLIGEDFALKYGGTVLRVQWLFGPGKSNFIEWGYNQSIKIKPFKVNDTQRGTPTYTLWLADKIVKIMDLDTKGIYHVAPSGSCTKYEAIRLIARMICNKKVVLSDSEKIGIAARPENSVFDTSKILKELNLSGFQDWKSGVIHYANCLSTGIEYGKS